MCGGSSIQEIFVLSSQFFFFFFGEPYIAQKNIKSLKKTHTYTHKG